MESDETALGVEENNHKHKLFTRGVGALLGNLLDEEDNMVKSKVVPKKSLPDPEALSQTSSELTHTSELEEGEFPKEKGVKVKKEKLRAIPVAANSPELSQKTEDDLKDPTTPEIFPVSQRSLQDITPGKGNLESSQESETAEQDNPHFIMSIEKQLKAIQTKQSTKKSKKDTIDCDSDGESEDNMEIEEENVIEVKKDLAIAAIKSVKSLDCPACSERFQHPRMLPCLHTFCSSCLQKRIEDNSLTCPICLRLVQLNLPTVDLLPMNTILDKYAKLVEAGEETEKVEKTCSTCEEEAGFWCVDCRTDFCEKCKKVHLNIKAVSDHKILTREEVQGAMDVLYCQPENCSEHPGNELNLYCETCDTLICRDCTVVTHKNHAYGFLKECVVKKRKKLQTEVEQAERKLEPLERLISAVEEDNKESEVDEAVKEQIQAATAALIEQIKEQEKEMIQSIKNAANNRAERLRNRYKEMRYAVESSRSSLSFMSALFRQGEMRDLVSLAPMVRKRIQEITAYRPEVELGRRIPHFKVGGSSAANAPPRIGLLSEAFDYSKIGIHPHLVGGEGSGGSSKGEFMFPTGLAFCPNGNIAVVDRTNRLQIFDSSGSFIKETTQEGDPLARLKNPNGVAVGRDGCYYIADSARHRIAVFTAKGKFSHEIGARGSKSSSPNVQHTPPPPPSSKYSSRGEVDNRYYGRDTRGYPPPRDYRSSGDYHRERDYYRRRDSYDRRRSGYDDYPRKREASDDHYGSSKKQRPGALDVELNGPRGVDISSDGLVVVADTTNHCVKVFTRDGVFIRTIGQEGEEPGQMRTPSGVSLDPNDNVYVTDTELHRITIFKISGQYITSFGSKGSNKGQFLFPSDVAVDKCGNVFVADCDNNRIQVFDRTGVFIRKFTVQQSGTQLKKPLGVAVDRIGNVLVCDTGNHKVWML